MLAGRQRGGRVGAAQASEWIGGHRLTFHSETNVSSGATSLIEFGTVPKRRTNSAKETVTAPREPALGTARILLANGQEEARLAIADLAA